MMGLFQSPDRVPERLRHVYLPGAPLAVTWVGHATAVIQIEDRVVVTDPVFTESVGQVSQRLVEPGVAVEALPPIDAIVVSHLHFDHLSLGSLEMLEPKARALVVPRGGSVYVPRSRPLPFELSPGQAFERGGLRVTAVPVRHLGWRYAVDQEWMQRSFTGYVIEYAGRRVFFGGDTAKAPEVFRAVGEKYGPFDLVLMPIAPIAPRGFMCRVHVDPVEALDAFEQLRGKTLVPIHFDTFVNSLDERGEAPRRLLQEVGHRGYPAGRVVVLPPGGRWVMPRGAAGRAGRPDPPRPGPAARR